MQWKSVLTISNALSFIRIFLIIPIFSYIKQSELNFALICIVLALISDWLDGYLARRLNQITEVGKALDPLADKICIGGGFIALTLYHSFPLWLTAVIILRDIIIITGSILIFGRKNVVTPSNITGKITVFIISLLGISYMLNIKYATLILTGLTIVMLIFSFIRYTTVFYSNVFNGGKSDQ